MTTRVVTDEQLGMFARRQHDLFRRVRDGGLDYKTAFDALQDINEGRLPIRTNIYLPRDGSTFTLTLDSAVDELMKLAGPWASSNPNIVSGNYPSGRSSDGEVRKISYKLKRRQVSQAWKCRRNFNEHMDWMLRMPYAEEALLPFAFDHGLGMDLPVVAFIEGSSHEFVVYEKDRKRRIGIGLSEDWEGECLFLGVVKGTHPSPCF